uniref:Putative secreted protein n=1 Tax=Anopheles marajoara TaxID=58244 RepID=A0A2M4CDK1_9DIPT
MYLLKTPSNSCLLLASAWSVAVSMLVAKISKSSLTKISSHTRTQSSWLHSFCPPNIKYTFVSIDPSTILPFE